MRNVGPFHYGPNLPDRTLEPPDDEPEEDGDEAAMDAADAKYEAWRDLQLERRVERRREVTSAE